MNESKLTCHWLPANAEQELSKPGMSQGDKRMWTERNGCKKLAVWFVHANGDPYNVIEACSEHLSDLVTCTADLVAGTAIILWPIKENSGSLPTLSEHMEHRVLVPSVPVHAVTLNGGTGTGGFISIVDPSKLKATGGG